MVVAIVSRLSICHIFARKLYMLAICIDITSVVVISTNYPLLFPVTVIRQLLKQVTLHSHQYHQTSFAYNNFIYLYFDR